ncbi:hypothetical protein BT63DRAFT_280952 [Microthyrium microscopicum]|uniref:YDG domain-containing protein n=1 Tax=Microthyrium microscopicum TaxID=703497 RepID=A0A6A6U9G4_9PEZI|nr:hypothetical protein BT63DRAFT_280952 [Microthyrium microscopicum]
MRFMRPSSGLPDIADDSIIAWDIRSDATELFRRWARETADEELSGQLMWGCRRGEINQNETTASSKQTSNNWKLAPAYNNRRYAEWGHNGVCNGQWVPYKTATLRDGSHGMMQAGISGKTKEGAWSITVAGKSEYDDRDEGDDLWYTGTKGNPLAHSKDTELLITAKTKNKEVRVIRAGRETGTESIYSPPFGFRYDGLYRVVDYKMVDPSISHYQFHLRRIPGQDPIRYQGVERRPTDQELMHMDRLKKQFGDSGLKGIEHIVQRRR